MKKINLRIFTKGLEEAVEFINEHKLHQEDVQIIIREGSDYRMLFWTNKPKTD